MREAVGKKIWRKWSAKTTSSHEYREGFGKAEGSDKGLTRKYTGSSGIKVWGMWEALGGWTSGSVWGEPGSRCLLGPAIMATWGGQ